MMLLVYTENLKKPITGKCSVVNVVKDNKGEKHQRNN